MGYGLWKYVGTVGTHFLITTSKVLTIYNIINGTLPTGYFEQNYSSSHTLNCIRTNYLYSSFVPSVIYLWNNLPDSVKTSSISVILRLTYLISKYCCLCSHCPFLWYKFHYKIKKKFIGLKIKMINLIMQHIVDTYKTNELADYSLLLHTYYIHIKAVATKRYVQLPN